MERQVNNLLHKNIQQLALLICLVICINTTYGQDLSIDGATKYTLGEISVTGTTTYNERTVIAFTGLRKGEELYLPGERINKVINKLWDLGLFSDINIFISNVNGRVADIEIDITEVPKLNVVSLKGDKKKKLEELKKELKLKKDVKLTENFIANTKNHIKNKYRKKGFLNVDPRISTRTIKDSLDQIVGEDMLINIVKGDKIKVAEIRVNGNEDFSDQKIRKFMKNTKQKNRFRIFKRSKLIPSDFIEDKQRIVEKLREKGYRDARVVSDTLIIKNEELVEIELTINEGRQYVFGDISFLGNSVYSDNQLRNLLSIRKGDVYNSSLLDKKITGGPKQNPENITDIYQDNGYLFSRVIPVETRVYGDTIDFEIRIIEGPIAYFNNISIKGNDRTNDHVAYRNLRTFPGEQYSKQAIMRTAREISQLGFFDPESIRPDIQNANPTDGTVDVVYEVAEQGASQVQLQGGYGGGGFIGTLGLSFNNFSLKGIGDKKSWNPLPMGDGQQLSLRAQASIAFQNLSLTFVEPWLGGKKPVQFSVSLSQTKQFQFNPFTGRADRSSQFSITGVNVGLGKRLRIPDEYFFISSSLGFQHFDLNNFNFGSLFSFPNGTANNFSFNLGLSRDNTFDNPIFPLGGSRFNISAKFTPPYSLFSSVNWSALNQERDIAIMNNNQQRIEEIDQERFRWLEFYKIKASTEWFNRIWDKLVLRTNIEFGFLGAYNNERGVPPFERFFVGGDGLAGFAMDGREIIALRGYPNQSIIPRTRNSTAVEDFNNGATIYNKYTLELRYPITLNPSASIYGLTFFEAGSTFDRFENFTPFELNRSAGAGLRIFMPQFGLLGIDFGYGFDPVPGTNSGANGWETHFIIGQQF